MRIAVISDLHCKYSGSENGFTTTALYADGYDLPVPRHPVKALKKLIKEEGIFADIILCPGDITDKADKQGLFTGWQFLNEIKGSFGTSAGLPPLLCTIGNHDVSSRDLSIGDPFKNLKSIDDNFPLPSSTLNNEFWAHGFSVYREKDVVILVINSSYYHNNAENAMKSRLENLQLEKLKHALDSLDVKSLNYRVCLSHHHPIKHANKDYPDDDTIDKGDELIKILTDFKFQILIHGHKHDPRLTVVNSLPVFCAGSFSSYMNITELGAENTFHIIELERNKQIGTIKSWVHNRSVGWRYKNDAYFPCVTGFGYKGEVEELAERCNEWLSKKKNGVGAYSALLRDIPDLKFLTPLHQEELSDTLKRNYQIGFSPNLPNYPDFLTTLEL